MDIVVCVALTSAQEARVRRGADGLKVGFCNPSDPCDAPIVFGNPEPRVIAANANLQWLQLESTGFDDYVALDWSRPGGPVQITNLFGFFADPAAETALAGILALIRRIDHLMELRSKAEWQGYLVRPGLRLLKGARVLLFGRGAINGRLTELLAPFGCQITTFGRDWTSDALDVALVEADIVVGVVPDTPATHGIFDEGRFARMKSGAIFCNLGRGSLVDEDALARSLISGHLGGAVIDVTRDEPLPRNHAFWTTKNTILTQHSGGGTADEADRKVGRFLENLTRFRAGQPLISPIDFARGY